MIVDHIANGQVEANGRAARGQPADQPYTKLHHAVIDLIPSIGRLAFDVYCALLRHADARGYCYPSLLRLAAICTVHKRSIIRALETLEKNNLIDIERRRDAKGRRRSNAYVLLPIFSGGDNVEARTNGSDSDKVTPRDLSQQGDTARPQQPSDKVTSPGDIHQVTSGAQEQDPRIEQDPQQKKTQPAGAGDMYTAPTPEEFAADWNQSAEAAGLPLIRTMSDKRKRALRSRGRDADWCATWRKAIHRIHASPFLLGSNGSWRANVDWFLKADSVTAILEGKYEPNANGHGTRGTGPGYRHDPNACERDPQHGEWS